MTHVGILKIVKQESILGYPVKAIWLPPLEIVRLWSWLAINNIMISKWEQFNLPLNIKTCRELSPIQAGKKIDRVIVCAYAYDDILIWREDKGIYKYNG